MRIASALFAAGIMASLGLAQKKYESEAPQRVVRLMMSATDDKGDPVTDLKSDEVTIREDGKPHPAVFFRFAGSRRPAAPLAPGEFANHPMLTPTLILFDRWNEQLMTAATASSDIAKALQGMESVEQVYIYFLTNHGDLFPVHPLPATNADLRVTPISPSDLKAKLDDAARKMEGFRDVNVQDPVLRTNTTMQALGSLGTQMAALAGRKNLIWVTHGFALTTPTLTHDWADFTTPIRQFSVAAARSQIAIYTVDQSARGAGESPGSPTRPTLQMFAALTGGRMYSSGDTDKALTDSMNDARGTYDIVYFSAVKEKDKKEHKIRLDTTRKGVRLLTREGYFGDMMDPDSLEVEKAAFAAERGSPFDADELGMRVNYTPGSATEPAQFTAHVDPADVLLVHQGDKSEGRLGVVLAFYSGGVLKQVSPIGDMNVDLTEEQLAKVQKEGITIPATAHVQSGIDKVRVMVFDRDREALGTVTIPVQ